MKRLTDIKTEVAKDKYGCTFLQACTFMRIQDIEDFMNEVAKRYAIEAVEMDRIKVANDPDWYFEPDDRKRIVNRPIELL